MRLAVAFALVSSVVNGQVSISPSDVTPGVPIEIKVLNEDGLGQSPGIPGIGFLGRGYDIFLGNPRGSVGSELDPGFRSSVVELRDSQDRTTLSKEFLLPFGVQAHDATSCMFESTSTEISTSQQLRQRLTEEASQSVDIAANFQSDFKIPVQISAAISFGGSQRFESFTESTRNTQTTTYEAKAQCNVFDLSFEPFSNETTFMANFINSLDNLPDKFCPFDNQNRRQYYDFMDAFGTHVVTNVALGAKHVYSTVMKSSDALELKRQDVDIKSFLSVSVQVKLGTKVNKGDEIFTVPSQDDDKTIKIVVSEDNEPGCPEMCPPAPPKDISEQFGGTFGIDVKSEISSSSSTEAINQIASKVATVNEVNVGGRPLVDDDFTGWAESARERPMPIKIGFRGIWEYMEQIDEKYEMKAKGFLDAIMVRRGIDLSFGSPENDNSILRALHFGIYRTDSEPIIERTTDGKETRTLEYVTQPVTSYSLAPNDNFRTSLAVQTYVNTENPPRSELRCSYDETFVPDVLKQKPCAKMGGKSDDNGVPPLLGQILFNDFQDMKSCATDNFVCGLETMYDKRKDTGERGLLGLRLFCCPLGYTSIKSQSSKVEVWWDTLMMSGNDIEQTTLECPSTEFIENLRVRIDNRNSLGDRTRGITKLEYKCDAKKAEDWTELFNVEDEDDTVLGFDQSFTDPEGQAYYLQGISPNFEPTQGLINLECRFGIPKRAPARSTLFYSAVWEGSAVQVSAFFVTMIHGKIGKAMSEDKGLNFYEDETVLSGSYHPFGIISLSRPSFASFGFIDFEDVAIQDRMPLASFLSADNLPDDASLIAGVIHPDLYAINEIFGKNNGFTVEGLEEVQSGITLAKVKVILTDEKKGWASFVAFPLWVDSAEQPASIQEITVSIKEQDEEEGSVTFNLGVDSQFIRDKLGFMFLSLRDLPTTAKGVVHGNFVDYTDLSLNQNCFYCTFEVKVHEMRRFVLIKFGENVFEAPPSVIVTPVEESNTNLVGSVPTAVVEYVTATEALVKVFSYYPSEGSTLILEPKQLPFNFVAVGPPKQTGILELDPEGLCN